MVDKKRKKLLKKLKQLGCKPPKRISHYLKLIYKKIGKLKTYKKCSSPYDAYDKLPKWKYKLAIIKRINRMPMTYDE